MILANAELFAQLGGPECGGEMKRMLAISKLRSMSEQSVVYVTFSLHNAIYRHDYPRHEKRRCIFPSTCRCHSLAHREAGDG